VGTLFILDMDYLSLPILFAITMLAFEKALQKARGKTGKQGKPRQHKAIISFHLEILLFSYQGNSFWKQGRVYYIQAQREKETTQELQIERRKKPMVEKTYRYSLEGGKQVERIVDEDPAMINHITLGKGDSLPEHYSDSNVYLLITKGILSLTLEDQERKDYAFGTLVNVPYHIKMNLENNQEALLEFFIVKTPHPRTFKESIL
jgi:quercetin dioxygenase-like cupin family protein